MADIKTNQGKLYKALQGVGFKDLGSEEQFAAKLQDANNRQKLFKALQKQGFKDLGDYDSFEKRIYDVGTKPQPQQPKTQPQNKSFGQAVKEEAVRLRDAAGQKIVEGLDAIGAIEKPSKQPSKDAITEKPLSPYITGEGAHQAFVGDPDFEASYDVGNGKRRKVSEDIQEARHNTRVTPAVQQYVDEKGNVVKENIITPVEPQEVAYDRYLRESRNTPTLEQQNQQRLDEVDKKLARAQEAELRESANMYNQSPYLFIANAINMAASPSPGANMMMANNKTEDRKLLEARKHLLDEGKRIIDEVKVESGEDDSIISGLKQAARNVMTSTFKKSTWDFGATDINTQTKLMEAIIRLDNGQQITDDERELLSDWALNNAVSSQYGNQLSGWAKAGQVTGESLPFMLEMALNPASGLGQGAQKGLVKYAMEKYGKKWVKDHAKGMLAGKIATRVVGDVLGGGIMAASTGLVRTTADAQKRYSEGMVEDVDQQGNIVFKDKEKRISPMEAFTKAWVANGIENSSEMWGEYLAPVTGILRNALGKAVIGKAGREALNLTGRLGDVSLNKAQRFIFDVTSQRGLGAISQGLDKFLKKTQWHGVFGEYIEEELGNLANAATVGDMTFDNAEDTGIFNLQQNIDTFAGVALMGGFMSALHTGAYAWDKWNNRMGKIEQRGSSLFSDWDDMKTIISSVSDDPIALNSTLTSYLYNKNMSQDQKRVVLDYAGKVLEKKGVDMAEYQPRMSSSSVKKQDDGTFSVSSFDAFGNMIDTKNFQTEDEATAYQGELKMKQQSRDMNDYMQLAVGLSYGESAELAEEFLGENPDPQAVADIQNPKTEIGRQFLERKNQRVIEKARASREAIAAFEEQNGWEPGTVRELTESDPMQMTDEEMQMADQAREFLKGLAYPNTEVHTEVSAQEGTEAAEGVVEQVASPDEVIDPANNAGQQIAEQWSAAQQARTELLSRNEDLAQEVGMLEQQGLSPQEILSSLETFSPQDRQVLVDYYNAQAKFDAYMSMAEQKINEVANMGRQRRTFKGTVNGNPDNANLIYITDGTNTYTLISGNVTANSDGRITGSDSGLIMAVDENGEIIQLSDASKYSIQPSGITLDQWEAAEVDRLQEAVSMTIDPNGALGGGQQPAQPQQPVQPQEPQGSEQQPTALSKIPVDEQNQPIYTQAQPGDTYDALVEQVGEQGAGMLAQSELNDAQKRHDKLVKDLADGKVKGNTMQEKIAEMQQMQQAIETEKQNIAYWQSVLNVPTERKKASEPVSDNALLNKYFEMLDDNTKQLALKIPKGEGRNSFILSAIKKHSDIFPKFNNELELENAKLNLNSQDPAIKLTAINSVYGPSVNFNPGTISDNQKKLNELDKVLQDGSTKTLYFGQVGLSQEHYDALAAFYEELGYRVFRQSDTQRLILEGSGEDVPEYRYDTPEAARKRGYKKVEGQRIDRQEEKPMPQGMEVEVQYSTKDKVKGRMTVSELGEVQGSHLVNGQRNQKNFIPEAQPKAEFGADRQAAAQSNASEENFRPELMLTFNGVQSAYSGSTTQTNRRGEVIQGNGRRNLAEFIYAPGNEAVAKRYREFLMAHAEELGTTAEEIAKMEKPFAHIVLDVTDEEAIRLGQFTAQDLETGGKKIPEVTSTVTKMGDRFGNFANIVLRHEDPDASLADRIEANAEEAVRWLNQGGYINNTEAKTLLEDKAAARQFIKDVLTDTLFSGASPDLRTMFYELPKNIQSAIVSVVGREVATTQSTSILKDIQESIQAYHELVTSSPQFAGAKGKNFEERFRAVTAAVNDWLRQINIDGSLNKGKYSNFALHLAKLYQSLKDQKTLAAKLREYYDLESGSIRQLGMFDDNTTSGSVTREEAIKQIFGVEYGRQGTVPLASNVQAGQGGEQGGSGRNSGGERGEGEGGPSEPGGGDNVNTPLTPEEIDGSSFPKQVKTLAKAYLNGRNKSELAETAYNDIYEEVRGSLPETTSEPERPQEPSTPQQPITTGDPIEAINEAAASFREGQNQEPVTPPTPPTPPSGQTETPEQKRARLKQEILAKAQALKDAQKNRKNDGGQAMSVIDPITALAAEGARIVKKSIIPQTKEERKIFWDLVQTTADYGYTYTQEGVSNFKEWSKRLYDDVVSTMQEIFDWTQEQVDEYISQVWNSEIEADGKTQTLAEFAAEKQNNANVGDHPVNEHKEENNEPENVVPLQQEARPTTKQGWLNKLEEVFEELCKKYGVPDEPIIFASDRQRYGFDYRITKGYQLEQFEPYYDAYRKKLDEEVEPATEKQLKYIERLIADDSDTKEILDGVKLNKISASYVISILKASEDAVYSRSATADVFDEYYNELIKVAKLAGKQFLEGDSVEFARRQKQVESLRKRIAKALEDVVFRDGGRLTLLNFKAMAKQEGLTNISDTDLQELVETEIVQLARDIANTDSLNDEQKYANIVRLYQKQPNLSARDNDRINLQQYSTPAPMAYLMGKFVLPATDSEGLWTGLEPSAGNGMLTLALPKENMRVNDIDEMRLSNLAKQGFGQVTSQDGLQSFGEKQYDVVVTNPPFGSVTPREYDGWQISGLEQQMAINALESMKDDGRAAIIIGGNTEYNQNGTIKGKDKAFFNYLYSHYNVVDVINMDGKALYSRQGTGYDVRMILINGRKPAGAPMQFAPVMQKARAERVSSYDELYKRVNDDILSDKNQPAGVHDTESGESNGKHDNGHAGASTQTGVRNGGTQVRSGEHQPVSGGGQRVSGSTERTEGGTNAQTDTSVGGGSRVVHTDGANASQSSRGTSSQADGGREGDSERRDGSEQLPGNTVPAGRPSSVEQKPAKKRELGTEKVPYRQQSSNPFSLQSQMPAEQAEVVKKALEDLGDVDQFLVDELGYANKEDLHRALAAEQIDSVALAIHQMKNGDAFIIGDQTGIGKGRQGAALIRWAVKNGTPPVYFTAKPELFSSVYRDIKDIGSDGLRPFILASDKQKARIVEEKDGKQTVLYDLPSDKEQKRVIEYINKNGKLPPEYDFMITTYSQVGNGTMEYENGKKKARSYGKNKKATTADYNGQAKRDAIESLAGSSVAIMDESHLAGGESARGNFLQYISTKAKGITYISATFAKRPDNMPIYALRTAISKAGVKVSELIDAVKRGGATFQEIMSKALTEAGQMIRRERDMTGVTVDWKGIEDEEVIKKHYEQYDTVIGLFNDIINFQRAYVDPIVNNMNDEAADVQGEVDHTPGTRDMGINNTPFASRTHQIVKQVLLSLKALEGAKFAIECLKNGEKPVICLENTNEGAADKAVGASDEDMTMPDLSVNLKQGLQGTMRITKKDAFGNTTNEMIPFDRLSPEGQARYQEIMDAIENASTGLSLSPIDVIKNEIRRAGYTIAELTGRKKEFVYNEDGTVKRVNRTDTDNKKNASDFNNGRIDAVLINKSAGTGIDLHAGIKFKNTDQRHMIVVQAQSDINDEVQMRGRTDRTGQKQHSKYTYIVSTIPSEQRLLMMLKAKLRSLDANTTSSQKSKFNEMQVQDIINKYGDEIVIQYLAEHPDLAMKMCDPLKWGEGAETLSPETLISQAQKPTNGGDGATASKVLGRMALLTVKEQEKMLAEIGDLYQAEIDRLNEMGENDLEITEMPLKAKTIGKSVWEEGVEPGGKNPFADNSYVETVEMDVLKKPMKAEEVKKAQERFLGGKTWNEYKQETLSKVEDWAANKKEETRKTITDRAEKKATAEREKYIKGAKKAQEKNGFTDEQIEKFGQMQYDTFFNQEMEKLNNALEAIDKQRQTFEDALETFTTDGVYALPTDIYDLSQLTFEPSFGKVIDINIKEDNYSTTASTITFATLDGRRKITIPISGMVKQNNGEKRDITPTIVQQTAQVRHGVFGSNVANTLKVLEQNVDNWDKLTSTATRKKGYIITGNLLKALTELRKQGKGGKLISYTTDTGDVRQGILMSDQFDPKTLTSKNPISSAKEDLFDWQKDKKVTSADGEVEIKNDGGGWFSLKVPKSKKRGEKYFNDQTLLDLVSGQFEGSSRMAADFRQENLDAILKRLDELGVTVESAKEEKGSIDTDNPIDAIRQAANGWRRSVKESESSLSQSPQEAESEKKSVPLSRRTMKSYTDKDGNYHTGIEEEIAGLEADIARAGREDAGNREKDSEAQASSRHNSGRRVNDLRKQAAKLRAEKARRNQQKQKLRKKYNIDAKGNISLEDVRRLFNDLNSNKILGKLFDKVFDIIDTLGTKFRFSDNFDALTGGETFGYFNAVFLNWDVFTRSLTDQQKAKIILHEMIHGVAYQLLNRYEDQSVRKLSAAQENLAKQVFDIFEVVKKANPKDKSGKKPYGLTTAHEMLSEISNPEFRELLDNIPYREGMSVWQRLKEWMKDVLGSFGFDVKGNTALNSLEKALDDILDNYDDTGIREYKSILSEGERDIRDAGYMGDIMDLIENDFLDGGGTASLVEDEELIKKLEAEPKIKVYRAMQLQDGKLYPPMAAKINGKWQDPLPIGEWSQADEHPELVDKNGKFDLDKGNGKKVAGVVYAPYMHGSTTMLNDQFKEAQDRPELVVVEAEMPESELTSGYQAEKSPRKTGMLDWKAGTIQGQLTGTRQVMLSRWVKPIRIVPSSEVAASIKQMIDGQVEVMPTNVVTPEQREELEKLGVKFVKTNNKEIIQEGEYKGEQYSDAYGKKSKKKNRKHREPIEDDPMQAIKEAASKWARGRAKDEGLTPEAHSAKAIYDERLNRVETVFSEAYQDSMVSLKTAQNAIAQDKDIPDSQNAYMAENLMHGKNKNEQDLYNKMFRDPLIATINKIMNLTGMNWGDVDRYVYTKSGLERNREFYVRDWLEAERRKTIRKYEELNDAEQAIFDVLEQRIEEDFDDGTIATEEEKQKKLSQALQNAHQEYVNQIEQEYLNIKADRYLDLQVGDSLALGMDSFTFTDYLNAIDDFIRRTIDYGYEPSEHDYSGFRAMFGNEDGKYNEAAIIEELMETEEAINETAETQPYTEQLWEQIQAATRYGLERYRESGMRSDEQIDRIEQMFHWYVPMRGFKDDMGEDMYQYFTGKGKEKSYMGGLLKHAKGRGSEANYPISTIFAMTYKAISDCNQNLVNQKLYRLCQANPNDLIVLSDSWAVLNEATGEWEEQVPEITDDMDEEEIREATLAWEEEMRQLATENKAKKIKGKEQFDYKPMDKKKQSEHIIDVRINGQPRKMIVTGNPRMAQALNGQLRFERGKNVFSKWNAAVKNMMASLFTSYSPTFALRNMFRDWTHFRMMLGVREGHGYAAQANKYYRQSLFKMVGLFKKYREGTLDESKEIERDFKDFMDNGGITGFVQMQKIDDIQKQMEKLYAQQKQGKTIRLNNKVWDYTLGAIEALNEGIENNARFATFRASRHYAGRTKARSAYDAKEITVNFNRKGAGGKTYGFKSQSKAVEDAAKAFGVTSQILGEGRIFFNATVQAIATTFKNFQNPDGSINGHYVAWWAMKYALPPFAFGLALPAINKALAAALGGDGDDDPYANLAEWTRRKNICIYIGNNNFITIPIGQELAAFLALGDIAAGNLYADNIKPVDRSWDDEILGVLNTFSPVDIDTKITKGGITEDPISEVTGRTFSVLAPLVAVEQNLGWTGRPIYREDKFQNDQYTPEYQMVYQSTNPVLVNASKLLHELGGGDDITRGKLEVNPAIVQYLWEQYTGGPGKVFSNTISIGKDAKDLFAEGDASDFNIRKVEGVKAFVQQGDDRTAYYRTQAKYRKYKEDAEKLYHDVKGYENAAAENPMALMKLQNMKGEDKVRMQIVQEAEKALSQLNKAANKAEGKERKELRKLYNQQIKAVVDMLDSVGTE